MGFPATLAAEASPLRMDADGVVRIAGTRVAVDTVIDAYQDGATAEEIVQAYDSLDLGDVYVVIGYDLRHRNEVGEYLARWREAAEQVRQEIDQKQPSTSLRERLLARRSQVRHAREESGAVGSNPLGRTQHCPAHTCLPFADHAERVGCQNTGRCRSPRYQSRD